MKTARYLGSTWVGSCVGSVPGSLYFAIVVAQLLAEEASVEAFLGVFLAGMVVSFPGLVVGSLLIGWWVTKCLAERVRMNVVLLFSMAGCLLGLLVAGVLAAVDHWLVPGQYVLGVGPWYVAALLLSVPVFSVTVAGAVTGWRVSRDQG